MGQEDWYNEDHSYLNQSVFRDNLTMRTNHSLSNFYSGLIKNVTHLTNITS